MYGRLLCLLCLLQVTIVWSLPVQAGTEQASGFQLETDASNCIEADIGEKVTLSCTYTGQDYQIMNVKWYRANRTTGCCAVDATLFNYWGVSVSLRTLRNHTAQSVTVQLIIDRFSPAFSGLYFCQAYNPQYPNTPIQSLQVTELIPHGSPVSPFLENCSGGQHSSQCVAPVPPFKAQTLCPINDDIHIPPCKPYSLQSITLLKYSSLFKSATFQLKWTKPVTPCGGYTWRARICQSDALKTQRGFTQTPDSDNIDCTAPWNYVISPSTEYWKFTRLQNNMHYIMQVERANITNTSERTVFTSPSMFAGTYRKPSIVYCPTVITASRGDSVTLQCVVTGNPKPEVKFLWVLQPMVAADALLAGVDAAQPQSDEFMWVHNETHGPWIHNLTISPQQNETYACVATNGINKGWGFMQEQVAKWIKVVIKEDK